MKQNLTSIIQRSVLVLVICITFCLGGLYFIMQNHCVDLSALEQYNPGKPSLLLDDQGNEWARFELDKREPVSLDNMPRHLINAFVAAEDWNFFSHPGISIKGILRATVVNLYHGKKKQGASTITQQLIKLLFFNAKKSFKRKIKEQLYTIFVERQFTKEQILQTYLNHLDFGCGIFGVEAACQRFWKCSVCDISLEQAATLAGMIRAPYRYSPLLCPLSSERRRNVVLNSMKKLGFITQEQYTLACAQPLSTLKKSYDNLAPHLKETIRQYVETLVGKHALYTQGLIIQTTLNTKIQKNAQDIFIKKMIGLRKHLENVDGALITIDVKTGDIKAFIGGLDFSKSPLNRAYRRRQMGSIFKPIIYAAALQQGSHFNDTEIDEPLIVELEGGGIWRPKNNTGEFEGMMTLARALSISNNMITIKTFLKTGLDPIIALAQKCHITSHLPRYPSLALGCVDVTLQEAVGAFNVFANNGTYVEPHMLKWIKNKWGTKIWRSTTIQQQALSPKISSQVVRVLSIGMHRFKRRMRKESTKVFDVESIGKTGTTNDCRTDWFCGSTPELTTGIYIGRDDNKSMGQDVYAVSTAFPIWFDLYQSLDFREKKFTVDPSLHEEVIHLRTGLPAYETKGADVFRLLSE